MTRKPQTNKTDLARNRKAFHEYEIGEKIEAGIVLTGTEVKSIRAGKINLADGWVGISDDLEAFLHQVSVSPYSHGNIYNHKETTPRKLLLKRSQIVKLARQTHTQGYSIVPLRVYLKDRLIKVEIAIGKGKKLHDKRESAKEKEAARDIERAFKKNQK